MADDIDNMQEIEERILAERIKKQVAKPNAPLPEPWCEACGEEIPTERRAILPYTTLCTFCAGIAEQKERKR